MVSAEHIIAFGVSALAMIAILIGVIKAVRQFCATLRLERMSHQYREVFDHANRDLEHGVPSGAREPPAALVQESTL